MFITQTPRGFIENRLEKNMDQPKGIWITISFEFISERFDMGEIRKERRWKFNYSITVGALIYY